MTLRLKRLKRLSTFTFGSRDENLSYEPTLPVGSSMPRLAASSCNSVQETVDFDSQFKQELERIRGIVNALFHSKFDSRVGHQPTFERGQLASLHEDLHALLLSKAGAFIFEFYQSSLLPVAAELMLKNIKSGVSDIVTNLTSSWQHFYTHVLPALEAIFCHVNSPRLSVRQASLLAFRDVIVLQLEPQLGHEISEMYDEGSITPALTQMLLVIQNVSECYPPSKQRLQLEKLTARAVSPYLGFRGMYSNGQVDPILPSTELDVAHLRRISVVDPRGLSRPLSVNSSLHMATLSDLLAVSADRFTKRTTSRENFSSYY